MTIRSLTHIRLLAFSLLTFTAATASAQLVPGTGIKLPQVGDNFEDTKWKFVHNFPKSSRNLNKYDNDPIGESVNSRWYEGGKRGQPDIIRRIKTPKGGLPGSKGSLLLMSRHTGIPGHPSYEMQQDDFICDVNYRLGGAVPVSQRPSVVVRVFMPKVRQWERRTGCTFAFRCAVDTHAWKRERGRSVFGRKIYYPGFFLDFTTKEDSRRKYDTARFRIRSNEHGQDYEGPQIKVTGWWTLGMSFTPEGRVHYYARPGIKNLTAKDRVASHFANGYRCERFRTFFFNVCSADDGRTWSTPWVIDDPSVFFVKPGSLRLSRAKAKSKPKSATKTR